MVLSPPPPKKKRKKSEQKKNETRRPRRRDVSTSCSWRARIARAVRVTGEAGERSARCPSSRAIDSGPCVVVCHALFRASLAFARLAPEGKLLTRVVVRGKGGVGGVRGGGGASTTPEGVGVRRTVARGRERAPRRVGRGSKRRCTRRRRRGGGRRGGGGGGRDGACHCTLSGGVRVPRNLSSSASFLISPRLQYPPPWPGTVVARAPAPSPVPTPARIEAAFLQIFPPNFGRHFPVAA